MMYLADNNQPIKLYIDSSGGEIRAGLALIDVIEMLRKKVQIDVVCIGKAYSMAAVILAAGGKGHRFLLPHAEVMIHEPLIAGGAGGSASTVKSTAESLIAIRDVISGLLSKYTGKSQEDINEAISRDLFMTADEAIKFGMADKIAEDI
jgi:ATP-dependent Clp protease protease subunit